MRQQHGLAMRAFDHRGGDIALREVGGELAVVRAEIVDGVVV